MAKDDPGEREAVKKDQIAIALSYQPQTPDDAPKVVATGRGKVAEQILEIAFREGVKVREDADLAQILSAVDVDSVIPLEAFMAVAEILAYVYRVNGQDVPQPPTDTPHVRSPGKGGAP